MAEKHNLALQCQRMLRGRLGREEFQLKRWEKINLAALKIQILYRSWRILQYTKKRNKSKINSITNTNSIRIRPKRDDGGNNNNSIIWSNILNNKSKHHEKMFVWRCVVELRRGYRFASTELCIKALMQSNCDISKAMTLLGSSEFSFQSHFGPPLEEDIKESLNPYRKNSNLRDEELEVLMRQRPNSASMRRAHKHLQQSLLSSAQLTREEYDLEAILLQSYYTKGSERQEKAKNKSNEKNKIRNR